MSIILARILVTRLRNWAEATGALDENQAGLDKEDQRLMQHKSL